MIDVNNIKTSIHPEGMHKPVVEAVLSKIQMQQHRQCVIMP
jgi:hypothetical protein